MKEQVEIVMATYNGEKYIKEQLDSLLSQSHPYLLVDVLFAVTARILCCVTRMISGIGIR